MNTWIEKSFGLASEDGYLDKLLAVYPMALNPTRPLDPADVLAIKKALELSDYRTLIKVLLKLEHFPIKDSYVAFLRRHPAAIDKNPITISRLGERVASLGLAKVVSLAAEPKETNTQLGPLFGRWLRTLGYSETRDEGEFLSSRDITVMQGSDNQLKEFINEQFGTHLEKGLDLVIKVKDTVVIGEAKFLTDYGGHQNAQFNDALNLLRHPRIDSVVCIAILDGVLWLPNNQKMNRIIRGETGDALSALLLPKYIEALHSAS
jgi:hypothetical protein